MVHGGSTGGKVNHMNYLIIVNSVNVNVNDLEILKSLGYIIISVNERRPYWEGYHYSFYIENLIGVKSLRTAFHRSGQKKLLGCFMISFLDILEIDHVIPENTKDVVKYIEYLKWANMEIEEYVREHWN